MGLIPEYKEVKVVPPFEELTMLLFGIPGVGKTRFCAGDRQNLFISTEPGQQFVATRPIEINDWATFQNLVKEIAETKKAGELDFNAVTIDIVDNLYAMCSDAVCKRAGCTHPSEKKDFGKTWGEITKEWQGWMRALMNMVNIRFISHCKTEEIEVAGEGGLLEEVTRYLPTFSGNKAAQHLDGVVNAMGFVTKNKANQHIITFKQSSTVAAKDRTDILSALGDIVLPAPTEAWGAVSHAYQTKAQELGFTVESMRK